MTPTGVGAHLVQAHRLYLRWCRQNATRPSPELAGLVEILATSGPGRTEQAEALTPVEDPQVLALTVTDAAAGLQISERTVRRLVSDGRLRAVRLGAAVRIPRTELDRLLADTPTKGDPDA